MLVSHKKNFIYLKTIRTASTSVEMYFEPYCVDTEDWERSPKQYQYVSESGIIGCRETCRHGKSYWYNHMPANEVRSKVRPSVWENYYKFCTIRNPFDKLVSYFEYMDERFKNEAWWKRSAWQHTDRAKWFLKTGLGSKVRRFRRWIQLMDTLSRIRDKSNLNNDRDKYVCNGEVCVDTFVEVENISRDLQEVCDNIGIAYNDEFVANCHSVGRSNGLHEYYTKKEINIVKQHYDLEIEMFEYTFK